MFFFLFFESQKKKKKLLRGNWQRDTVSVGIVFCHFPRAKTITEITIETKIKTKMTKDERRVWTNARLDRGEGPEATKSRGCTGDFGERGGRPVARTIRRVLEPRRAARRRRVTAAAAAEQIALSSGQNGHRRRFASGTTVLQSLRRRTCTVFINFLQLEKKKKKKIRLNVPNPSHKNIREQYTSNI